MKQQKFDQLLNSFRTHADSAKNLLHGMLSQIQGGMAPPSVPQEQLNDLLETMRLQYEEIRSAARQISPEEADQCQSTEEYANIYHKNYQQFEEDIRQFLNIKAANGKYQKVLVPYQQRARRALNDRSANALAGLKQESHICHLFLEAIRTDVSSPSGEALLEQLDSVIPEGIIQRGLCLKKYTLSQSQNNTAPIQEKPSVVDTVPAPPQPVVPQESERMIPLKEPFKKMKSGKSAFRSTFMWINQHVPRDTATCAIPMMYAFGLMTLQQIMKMIAFRPQCDYIKSEQVQLCLTICCSKGFTGAYDVDNKTAYCLSPTAAEYFSKADIRGYMLPSLFSDLPLFPVAAEQEISASYAACILEQNDLLIHYLQFIYRTAPRAAFLKIHHTVRWTKTRYRIAVYPNEDTSFLIYRTDEIPEPSVLALFVGDTLPETVQAHTAYCCTDQLYYWTENKWETVLKTTENEDDVITNEIKESIDENTLQDYSDESDGANDIAIDEDTSDGFSDTSEVMDSAITDEDTSDISDDDSIIDDDTPNDFNDLPEAMDSAITEENTPDIFDDDSITDEDTPDISDDDSITDEDELNICLDDIIDDTLNICLDDIIIDEDTSDDFNDAPEAMDGDIVYEGAQDKLESPIAEIPKTSVSKNYIISASAPMPTGDEALAACQEMLCKGNIACASAFLKYLSMQDETFQPAYQELAYAVDDPLFNCHYYTNMLFNVYFNTNSRLSDSKLSEYLTISAALRNCFSEEFDYDLKRLHSSISKFTPLLNSPALSQVIHRLIQYKNDNRCGVDRFADYHKKEQAEIISSLENIRKNVKETYENYFLSNKKEHVSFERFIQTQKIIFDPNSTLGQCFDSIIKDERELTPDIQKFLHENYIRDDSSIRPENIDKEKIETVIEKGWNKSAERISYVKKSSTLPSPMRMSLKVKIEKAVTVLCEYISCIEKLNNAQNVEALNQYQQIRTPLLENIEQALAQLPTSGSDEELAGCAVLRYTLRELQERLQGVYLENASRYFYIDFLRGDKILLNDDGLPILDDVEDIEAFSAGKRILLHMQESDLSFPERFSAILQGGDDYGSASWILRYLRDTGYPDIAALEGHNFEEAISYAQKDASNRFQDFKGNIELAESYGQIDSFQSGVKENMIENAEHWLEIANQTHNYGFFKQLIQQYMYKLQEGAHGRAEEISASLEEYLHNNPGVLEEARNQWAVQEIRQRLQNKNYTAAEDLFGRLLAHDIDPDTDLEQTDDLADFLNQYNDLYRTSGNSSKRLSVDLTHTNRARKEVRGGTRLMEKWIPNGAPVSKELIESLMLCLGFSPASVEKQTGKLESFIVTLKKPKNGRKSNYAHSIAAFGSQAENDGFRVVCLFGKYDVDDLIETFQNIGVAKHTIALLDFRLKLSERRDLARKVKFKLPEKIFGVIDRVLLMYLVCNYSETSVNRKLMSLMMPFTFYQPYVAESSRQMPPEIFIGRKAELQKIEDAGGVNLVYGGRQLGKSALLKRAKNDIDNDENGDRAVFVDIKDMDYKKVARRISQELSDTHIFEEEFITEDWDELARAIRNRLKQTENRIPYLLLLMDEADVFIDSCGAVNYQPFNALKDIQNFENNRFKFVVAGLHNVVRLNRATRRDDSVLPHYSSMTITPFKAAEARELLETPLRFLGFRFPPETDALVSMIFGTTNYFPGLLQYYCSQLIEAMSKKDYAGYSPADAPPYIIQEKHIKKVLVNESFQEQIREKFFITLEVGKDNLYYQIALLIAYRYHTASHHNGCSPADILETAQSFNIRLTEKCDEEKVRALMDEMRELNVLQAIGNGNYRFSRHNFLNMMGSIEHIEDCMAEFMEE